MTLTKWYEKTIYVIGWIVVVLVLFSFFVTLMVDIAQNAQPNSGYSQSN